MGISGARQSLQSVSAQVFGVDAVYVARTGGERTVRVRVQYRSQIVTEQGDLIANATTAKLILGQLSAPPLKGDRIVIGERTWTVDSVQSVGDIVATVILR